MVRTNSGVYTEVRYQELLREQEAQRLKDRPLIEKVSDYYGLQTMSDKIWFYGFYSFCSLMMIFLLLFRWVTL